MRSLIAALLAFASTVPASANEPTLVHRLEVGRLCERAQCVFVVGRSLRFTLTGVGRPDGGVVFERSDSDGDFYASFGLSHGCIIVHNGAARPPILTEVAFVQPRTGKVFSTWIDCKSS
jgi:hypothetical protein